jgi:hypothetical protein
MIFDAYLTLTFVPYRSQEENEKGLDLSSLASSTMRFPRTEILDGEPVGLTCPNPVGPTSAFEKSPWRRKATVRAEYPAHFVPAFIAVTFNCW